LWGNVAVTLSWYYFDMDKDPGAVALGKKRALNLRKKLGSERALKPHMRRVRAGEKLS
jgi:hypothetical protein